MTMPLNKDFSVPIMEMIKKNVTLQALNLQYSNIADKDEDGKNALYFSIEQKIVSIQSC